MLLKLSVQRGAFLGASSAIPRYKGRFVVAFAAMLLYAAASAAVAYLIKPIIDEGLQPTGARAHLPDPRTPLFWSSAVLIAYLVEGLGAYFSAFLMTDIGQRVVRDLVDQLFKHILDQSAAFFSRWSNGPLMSRITNDVSQVQQAVSETVGDLLREGLLLGYAALPLYSAPPIALSASPALHWWSIRWCGWANASVAAPAAARNRPNTLAHRRRGVCRSSHRQGVRRRGARGAERFKRASNCFTGSTSRSRARSPSSRR